MLKCGFKSMTGVDCPGCGVQRSFLALIKGDLLESVILYPALLPFLFTFIYCGFHLIFNYKNGARVVVISFITSTVIMLTNYILKLII